MYYQDDRSRLRFFFLNKGLSTGKESLQYHPTYFQTPPTETKEKVWSQSVKTSNIKTNRTAGVVVFVIVIVYPAIWQARNQDFMWGGANEAKVDQTTEMYFLFSDSFI